MGPSTNITNVHSCWKFDKNAFEVEIFNGEREIPCDRNQGEGERKRERRYNYLYMLN